LSSATRANDLVDAIDSMIAKAVLADGPGISLIVTRNGKSIYHKARGMANLELGVPLETSSVFRIGSITKQFTAAAVMLLAEDGKLSIEDDITKFLPDYPTHGHKITIEHLLTHTSGIKSYTDIPHYTDASIKNDLTVTELIDVFKNQPMDFAPGERFAYTNSGYVLLGAIIEKLSGENYESFLQKRIFDPLEMRHSFYGQRSRIINNRATGYQGSSGQPLNAAFLSMTQPYTAGSLLSTTGDLDIGPILRQADKP